MAAGGSLAAAVAVERRHTLVVATRGVVGGAAGEVAGPVFFTGEKGAPRRVARAAVVDGAAAAGAGVGVQRLHQRAASCRAADFSGRQRRDAAVVGRGLRVGKGAVAALGHFDDADAVGRNFLVGLQGRARTGRTAGRMQEVVGQGLVVHGQQAAAGAVIVSARAVGAEAEVLHAVVVVAGAVVVVGVGAVVTERRSTCGNGVAQGVHDGGGVTRGHRQNVGSGLGNCREAQLGDSGGNRRVFVVMATGGQTKTSQHGGGRGAEATAQHRTAAEARVQHLLEAQVGAAVAVLFKDDGQG